MEIRSYRADDREDVVALWHAAGLVVRPKNDPDADIDLCIKSPDADILVGVDAAIIVATVMVGHDGHRGWMYYVGVAPAYRGKGYGRQMVVAAETWHRARGIPKSQLMIRDTNAVVEGFYRRLGYETVPRIVMQKVL